MLIHRPHAPVVASARAQFDLRHPPHRRAVRLALEIGALEIAFLVAVLVAGAFPLSPLTPQTVGGSGSAGQCVHLGRAGGHCPPGAGDKATKPDSDRDCLFLGRAGRYCPAAP